MAKVTTNLVVTSNVAKIAREFNDGDILVDSQGRVGLRTSKHIVRANCELYEKSLFILPLYESSDTFTLAPPGTSFTISN